MLGFFARRRRVGRFPAFQRGVVPRDGVLDRLQVREDRQAGHGTPYLGFNTLEQVVAALDGPLAWNQYVDRHEAASTGPAGPERVELDAPLLVVVEHLLDRVLDLGGEGRCREGRASTAAEAKFRPG